MASRAKKSSPLGTSLFIGLRAADVALQYSIFRAGWGAQLIQTLGGSVVPLLGGKNDYFGLPPHAALLTALAAGSALKQNLWLMAVSENEMRPSAALSIAAFNTLVNSLNSLLALWAVTSAAPVLGPSEASIVDVCRASPGVSLGLALYAVGIFTELFSEIQRSRFKKDPANKGKPYGGGLFSLATNINYGGYTLWRTGYAIVAAGLPWGALVGSFFFYDFAARAIPELDDYCTQRVRICFSAHGLVCFMMVLLLREYTDWILVR